jgi:hypothetical protein
MLQSSPVSKGLNQNNSNLFTEKAVPKIESIRLNPYSLISGAKTLKQGQKASKDNSKANKFINLNQNTKNSFKTNNSNIAKNTQASDKKSFLSYRPINIKGSHNQE